MKSAQERTCLADESNRTKTTRAENTLVKLLVGSIGFSVAILAMLLGILLDLSGSTIERIRLIAELLSVIGVGGFAMWFVVAGRERIRR